MSENRCEKAAIEALVTVCRALSQLEVGQFAVASFGRKGNIKLLHDFDQTFMGEAGVKVSYSGPLFTWRYFSSHVCYLIMCVHILVFSRDILPIYFGADDL